MKKILNVLLALSLIFTLVACGGSVQTKTFVASKNGVDLEVTYTFSGDRVLKQTANNKIPYSALGVTTKEEAKAILDPISQQYQGIEGLEEKLDYGETQAIETLTIDYEKVDFEKLTTGEIPGVMIDEAAAKAKKISMKESEKLLLESGFTEKQ